MDKNTVTALVLMAAVMFGFMWLQKPSAEQLAAEQERREQLASEQKSTASAAERRITFTADDSAALAATVRQIGTRTDDGAYILRNADFDLRADSLSLSGTATVGNTTTNIRSLLANRSTLTMAQTAKAADAVRTLIDNALRYEGFARHLSGSEEQVTLENELIRLTLDTRGGIISQAELKKYNSEIGDTVQTVKLFKGANDGYSFRFATADQRIDTRDFYFRATAEGDSAVLMSLEPAPGVMWGIRYTLAPDGYDVRMEIVQNGMSAILPANTASIDFNWHQRMGRNEIGRTFEERNSAIYYKYVGDSPDDLNANGDDSKSLQGNIKWVAFKNQFFSSVIVADEHFSTADLASVDLKTDDYLKDMAMTATLPYSAAAEGTAASFHFYLGPNDYPILSGLDERLDAGEDLSLTRLIPLGWGLFRWINTIIIIPVFTFLGSFLTNYGLIILLLTIFIKIIIFPFTFKSYKSQARMRVLAPEIKEINEKYPGDENAMKRQQETMSLYSRAGASPFSGCLPMLLQMPVLIAMFSFFPSAIELRGHGFLWAHDLSAPDSILTLPFNIPFYGSHVSLFCLLMTIVNIVYTKINMQSQPGGASMPGMKLMTYMMPVMFLFIFNDYASGLSYYYLLSLLITIFQTWIFRRVIDEDKVRAQLLENARKPRKKSGFMARLEEAQRQQQAALRAQQQAAGKKGRKN